MDEEHLEKCRNFVSLSLSITFASSSHTKETTSLLKSLSPAWVFHQRSVLSPLFLSSISGVSDNCAWTKYKINYGKICDLFFDLSCSHEKDPSRLPCPVQFSNEYEFFRNHSLWSQFSFSLMGERSWQTMVSPSPRKCPQHWSITHTQQQSPQLHLIPDHCYGKVNSIFTVITDVFVCNMATKELLNDTMSCA